MANLMIYARKGDEKRFSAVNLSTGEIGVGLVYATLVPEEKLDALKSKLRRIQRQNPDTDFQIRYAGTTKVVYELTGCKTDETTWLNL